MSEEQFNNLGAELESLRKKLMAVRNSSLEVLLNDYQKKYYQLRMIKHMKVMEQRIAVLEKINEAIRPFADHAVSQGESCLMAPLLI